MNKPQNTPAATVTTLSGGAQEPPPPPPPPPAGLNKAGRALWQRITDVFVLTGWETTVLEAACRQADDVARMEATVRRYGVMVEGSMGQKRLNQAIAEARAGRIALGKLIDTLRLPARDDDGEEEPTLNGRSARASKAAAARWDRRSREAERRQARGLA